MSDDRFPHPACHLPAFPHAAATAREASCRHALPGGACAIRDLMALHALHGACADRSIPDARYFGDALLHFIARDCASGGTIGEGCIRALETFLSERGAVTSADGLELVLRLIESESGIPHSLACFALDQVRIAIEEKRGIYAALRAGDATGVAESDLFYINRIFRALSRRGQRHLPEEQKHVLAQIDGAAPGLHHPAWEELMALMEIGPDGGTLEPAPRRPWLRLPEAQAS